MSRQRTASTYAGWVAWLSAVATACGPSTPEVADLMQTDLEQRIEGRYEPIDPADSLSAACRGDLRAEEDATQDCTVTTGDQHVGVRVRVTDAEAEDLGIETTPFLPRESVAEAIASALESHGYTEVEAACDGDLIGEAGREIVCRVSTPDGESRVDVDVTSVDGLLVTFDFKSE